jgi:peptide/nickel transport system permease protein
MTERAAPGGLVLPRWGRQRRVALVIGRQALGALLTLVAISVVCFFAVNTRSPHGIAVNALGREAAPEQIDAFIQDHDLDHPLVERYVRWLGQFIRGDMGTSAITEQPVSAEVFPRLGRTLLLILFALALALPISLAGATYLARRAGGLTDFSMLCLVVILGFPEFILGLVAILIVGVWLDLLPTDSTGISYGTTGEHIKAYVLPAVTLAVSLCPYLMRIGRASIKDVLGQPYVQAAILRGLSADTIVWRHALPNAAAPIINAVALNIYFLVGGTIVVENLFGFPGLGQLLVSAIGSGDTFTVQAIALLMGTMIVATSIAADLLVLYFNPRLRAVS